MSDEEKDLTEEISVAADKGLTDEQITEEVKLKEEKPKKEEKAKKEKEPKEEKAKKEKEPKEEKAPKPKKEKKTKKGSFKGIKVGSNEEVELELTKESLATYSSYRKGGTVIKLKGVPGKILVELTAEEYEALIEL